MDGSGLPWSNWPLTWHRGLSLCCAAFNDSWSNINLSARLTTKSFTEANLPRPRYWDSGWVEVPSAPAKKTVDSSIECDDIVKVHSTANHSLSDGSPLTSIHADPPLVDWDSARFSSGCWSWDGRSSNSLAPVYRVNSWYQLGKESVVGDDKLLWSRGKPCSMSFTLVDIALYFPKPFQSKTHVQRLDPGFCKIQDLRTNYLMLAYPIFIWRLCSNFAFLFLLCIFIPFSSMRAHVPQNNTYAVGLPLLYSFWYKCWVRTLCYDCLMATAAESRCWEMIAMLTVCLRCPPLPVLSECCFSVAWFSAVTSRTCCECHHTSPWVWGRQTVLKTSIGVPLPNIRLDFYSQEIHYGPDQEPTYFSHGLESCPEPNILASLPYSPSLPNYNTHIVRLFLVWVHTPKGHTCNHISMQKHAEIHTFFQFSFSCEGT